MSPGDPVVRRYLGHSLVARVATRARKGEPALTPLYFVVHRGRIYLGTGQATLAARNAAANPEVAILFDGERLVGRPEHVLRVRGRATVHHAMPPWPVLARMALKYYAAPGGALSELAHARLWRTRSRYYAQSQPALLEIEPESAELLRRPD